MATEEKENRIELTELEPDQDQPAEESKDVKGGAIFATATRTITTISTTTSPTSTSTLDPDLSDDFNPFFKS